MPERLNEEIRRRTYVVRIFPMPKACLRLVRALARGRPAQAQEARRTPSRMTSSTAAQIYWSLTHRFQPQP
ncbi:MAG: hypothetical protein EOS35_27775 [Mesorhizobium sp.]|nr:MAG: hypothetical protein EOS35_27775 [Mesorhizobium sp.]